VIERFQEGSYGGLLTNLQAAIAAGRPPAVAQIGYNFRLFAFNELPHVPIATSAIATTTTPSSTPSSTACCGSARTRRRPASRALRGVGPDALLQRRPVPRGRSRSRRTARHVGGGARSRRAIRDATGRFGIGIQISSSNNWVPRASSSRTAARSSTRTATSPSTAPTVDRGLRVLAGPGARGRHPAGRDRRRAGAGLPGGAARHVHPHLRVARELHRSVGLRHAHGDVPHLGRQAAQHPVGRQRAVHLRHDPAEQQAAFEFIAFLTSREGQTIWVRDTGYLPVAAGVEDDPAYLADFFAENPLIAPAVEQLPMPSPGCRCPASAASRPSRRSSEPARRSSTGLRSRRRWSTRRADASLLGQ
jgi:multiple sugar transport system substrate-binding protein